MRPSRFISPLIAIILFLSAGWAEAFICDPTKEKCWEKTFRSSSSSPAVPTTSSTIRINPSAVPVEKGFGVETIAYKGEFDFALVQGLGRVGAAISPSNSEETFFGPPGFEHSEYFLKRKDEKLKFPSQKTTLATAFNIIGNKKSGLQRFDLNVGVLGKYNNLLKIVTPGGGVTAVLGPFSLGYATYGDATLLQEDPLLFLPKWKIFYRVETYSAGLFLSSVALDYSVMRIMPSKVVDANDVETQGGDVATIAVGTASLILSRGVFTISLRKEDSDRPFYNYDTKALEFKRDKTEVFGGAQLNAGGFLMFGVFYNYYLLRELSFGLTLFF